MFCICSDMIPEINGNYAKAAEIYSQKRNMILQKLETESNTADQDFLQKFNENYNMLLDSKYKSEATGRNAKINTILQHLYKAVEAIATNFISEQDFSDLENEITLLKKEREYTDKELKQVKNKIDKLIQNYFNTYFQQNRIDELVKKFLPNYISTENATLTAQQLYGYTQSILKKQILENTSFTAIKAVVHKTPATLLGYIREDMIVDAALKVIEELKLKKAFVTGTGANKTAIDILISLNSNNSFIQDDNILSNLLNQLDSLEGSIIVTGESQYNTEDFIGIQSKSWDLSKPITEWHRFSVGSRASLLSDFQQTSSFSSDIEQGWHRGVLFLSQHIPQILGGNTVMYAIKGEIMWTDTLITNLYNTYHKYFAFVVNEKTKQLTKHIELAEHYG